MSNILRTQNSIIDMDKVEIIYEEDGKTKLQFPGGSHYFGVSLSEFLEKYSESSESTENEAEKELARVTRDYEELARENDRLKEMVGQLFTANGRLVYANILKERRKGPRRWR